MGVRRTERGVSDLRFLLGLELDLEATAAALVSAGGAGSVRAYATHSISSNLLPTQSQFVKELTSISILAPPKLRRPEIILVTLGMEEYPFVRTLCPRMGKESSDPS